MEAAMKLFIAACVLATGLSALGAVAAEPFKESPITPGYWSYPLPTFKSASRTDSCWLYLGIVYSDDEEQGFSIAPDPRDSARIVMTLTNSDTCKFDAAQQKDLCTSRYYYEGEMRESAFSVSYSIEPDGTLKAVTSRPGDEDMITYPVKCLDADVREILKRSHAPGKS
jgi:hypothetical protein